MIEQTQAVFARNVRHAGGIVAHAGHERLFQCEVRYVDHRVRAAVCTMRASTLANRSGGGVGTAAYSTSSPSKYPSRSINHFVSRMGQNPGDQAASSRFAVGPGHADVFQHVAGMACQGLAYQAVGFAGIGNQANWNVRFRQRAIAKDAGRATPMASAMESDPV